MQAAFTPPSTLFTFIAHCLVCHQHTLHTARLLDPCFKTGWREEDFKRAGLGDWWALHGNPANRGTINCPPTVRPPPRRRASIETLGFSSAHPSSLQAPSCEPLCGVPLWSPFSSLGTLPFFALAQWTRRALLLFPFCSLYAISGSFNLPFGILFNFPSQYFSAIGLHVIFRFGWNLPAALRWNHNQRDSKRRRDLEASFSVGDKGLSPSLAQLSNWVSHNLGPTCIFLKRSIGLASVLLPNPFPLIFAFFVRHYWTHHVYFLYLRLIICLNSAGNEEKKEVEKKKEPGGKEYPTRLFEKSCFLQEKGLNMQEGKSNISIFFPISSLVVPHISFKISYFISRNSQFPLEKSHLISFFIPSLFFLSSFQELANCVQGFDDS